MGVPFVEAVLNEITDLIQQRILPALNNISHKTTNYNPLAKPGQVDVILQPINGRGRAYNLDETMGEIAYAYRGQFETGFLSALSRNLMPVLDDFRVSGLSRLVREINDAHADLIEADRRKDINTNLADVSTDDPVAWPTDLDERISDRFHGSYNEILITEVDSFPQDYDSHLVETVRVSEPTVFDVTQASRLAARPALLTPCSRWVSPETDKHQFDLYSFVAALPHDQEPDDDDSIEVSSTGWFPPSLILDGWRAGLLRLVIPTWAHMLFLSEHTTVKSLLDTLQNPSMDPVLGDPIHDPRYQEFFTYTPPKRF